MPLDNSNNQSRVRRMIEALEHIETSAKSNRASQDDVAAFLQPVRDKLAALTGGSHGNAPAPTPAPAPVPARGARARTDIVLWQEAQTAPLEELMLAWSTINTRLADLVDSS